MSFEENSGILKFDVVTWSDIPQCWEIVSECCRADTSQLSPAESPLACQKIESETEKLIKMFYLSSEKRMSMILWNWVVYSDCEHFHDHLCSPLACPSEVHHLIYNDSKKNEIRPLFLIKAIRTQNLIIILFFGQLFFLITNCFYV